MTEYKVRAFGQDCLGNISGYLVERFVWRKRPWSGRNDGLCCECEVVGKFVGDIYNPGSFDRAYYDARRCASEHNATSCGDVYG